jgi:hypothetical protein
MSSLIGRNRRGNALLCYLWGETEVPVVAIARTTDDVKQFIANEWTGESDCEELSSILQQIDEYDFSADYSKLRIDFEIGGAIFEDVAA